MKKYSVRSSQTADIFGEFDSIEDARAYIEEYERQDRINDCYERNFYEIYDNTSREVIYI